MRPRAADEPCPTRSPVSPDPRQGLLDRLAGGPARVAGAARAAAAVEAQLPLPPGEWSAREIVGHLVATEREVFHARLDQLATGGPAAWDWVEPGVASEAGTATLDGALERFAKVRDATLARVLTLDETGWSRAAMHTTYGRLDVAGLLTVLADHDDDHRTALLERGDVLR